MGSTRLVLVVVLAGAFGFALLHPGLRPKLHSLQREVRWRISGKCPDDHYRQAERYYNASDFIRARRACCEALRLEPQHPCARALLTEIEFIQAGDRLASLSGSDRTESNREWILHQQQLVELDNLLARANRHFHSGQEDLAGMEYRDLLEYAERMPVGVQVERRAREARQRLSALEN